MLLKLRLSISLHFFLLRDPIPEITLNGDVIESSPAARDLGVSLDHYVKLSTCVNDIFVELQLWP